MESLQPHNTVIRRGETRILEQYYRSYGASQNLSEATSVIYRYKPTGGTNYYAITGSVYNATGGICRVRWDSSCEATNSTYSYDIFVSSASSGLCRAYGTLTLTADVTYNASAATNPTPRTSIDWLTAINYNTLYAPFFAQPTNRQAGDMWYYDGTNTVRFPIGTAGQTLLVSGSAPQWGNAGAGDMLTSIYDPLSVGTTAVFVTDSRLTNARPPAAHTQTWATVSGTPDTLAGYGITNAATAAQGALADTALQPATTNGWEVGSHTSFLTAEADTNALAQLNTHTGLQATAHGGIVTQGDTNGWEVGSHASFLTAEADTNALAQLAIETNRAAQAEAALVSKTDTNGWEVGSHASFLTAEADTNALAQLIIETNRAAQAEAAAKNAANHTNRLGSFVFQICTSSAPYNISMSPPLPYAITLTNFHISSDGCGGVADYFTAPSTNPNARTLIYTGATYTAGAVARTNYAAVRSIAADTCLGVIATNGSITNLWIGGQYTW